MNLSKAIPLDCVKLRLSATSKAEVIEELIGVLDQAGKLAKPKAALKAVLEREKKMTTGLRDGIAIPHGKSDSVESLVAAVGLIPEGLDFESMDERPSSIFILTISPTNRAGPHTQFLGDITRRLLDESSRCAILAAEDVESLHALLTCELREEDDDEDDDEDED